MRNKLQSTVPPSNPPPPPPPRSGERGRSGERARGGAGGVQSVDRAARALEILASTGGAGVTEVAELIGVHKSTAFRLLAALEEHDLVQQSEARGQYELGFGIQRLAGSMSGQMDLVRQARPIMEALADELGETVNVAVLRETYTVNVGQAIGSSAVSAQNWIGELTPPHATSSGKVLLAALPPAERRHLLPSLEACTPQTITDPTVLEAQLQDVARRGWAETLGEYEVGLHAVAVPVRDHTEAVIAALSVSGPSYRLGVDRISHVLPKIIEAGRAVSTRMGHFSD